MGFFGDFAYGFKQTADPIIKAKGEADAQADARIREKVAEVDPAAQLYQRQKDIDFAESVKKNAQSMDQFNQIMGNGAPAPAAAPTDGSTAPTANPTITSPDVSGSGGGVMSPTSPQPFMPSGSQATSSVDDHYNAINRATTGKAIADLAGNTGAAAAFDTQIKLHTAELDRSKRIKEDNKDTLTAADGVIVPEAIQKDVDKNTTGAGKTVYQTGSLEKVSVADTAAKEQDIAENVHIPLAASYLTANPNNKEVSSVVKNKTLKAAQFITTINSDDPVVTPEEKQKALTGLESYMKETYKHSTPQSINSDTNLQHVFNPELVQRMAAIKNIQAPAAAEDTPAEPVTLTKDANTQSDTPAVTEGTTATNPQTGEKVVYTGGAWKPMQ